MVLNCLFAKLPRRALGVFVALSACVAMSSAVAQEWPTGTVRVVVPFPPGGATDVVARLVAQQLALKLGKPFPVENIDGAGGSIGTAAALKAPADGNTLLIGTVGGIVTGPILRKNAGSQREPADDAVPVTRFYASGSVVMVNPAVPVRNIPELIDYVKRDPEKLFYGSAGIGSNSNLIAEYFKWVAKIRIDHVPFRGTGPAFNELLANRVQLVIESQPTALSNILAGKVRALGVTTKGRVAALPQVARVAETPGMESFEAISWVGLFVAPGTPRPIITKLYRTIVDISAVPEVQERMKALGAPFETITPEEFASFVQAERVKWAEVIRVGGITGG